MGRSGVRALQGLVLSAGSPLGWLLLRWLDGASPALELSSQPGIYLYLLVGTACAFTAFGWYVGWQEGLHRENSLHDALTGLYNTRYFWRRLEDECAFATRHGRPLALLIGDIDWFKRVNDGFGHAAGDRVLAGIAGALMALRRRGDTIVRIGGEEFGVILPDTDLAEAVHVAERLRAVVGALKIEADPARREEITVTMSFGVVASTPDQPRSAGTLYERADAAMYRAKQAGRNRVATSVDDNAAPPMPSPA